MARVAATEEVDGIRDEKDPGGLEEQRGLHDIDIWTLWWPVA
jgi:hypothetical protein